MKRLGMNLMMAALFCCTLVMSTITATANDQKMLGKNKQKTVTFLEDVLVNDQMVKKGTYRVKFDAANSTVIIMESDGEVVAKAKANVKLSEQKALYNSISSSHTAKGKVMTSLTFGGDKRIIVLEEPTNVTAEAQAQR